MGGKLHFLAVTQFTMIGHKVAEMQCMVLLVWTAVLPCFLFKSDFNPSLIAPGKATANIHGYGASMTQTGDLKGKTYMYIFDEDDPSIGDTIAPMVTTMVL